MYQLRDRGFTMTTVSDTGYGRLQGSEEGSSFHCSLRTNWQAWHTVRNSPCVESLMNRQQNKKTRLLKQTRTRGWTGPCQRKCDTARCSVSFSFSMALHDLLLVCYASRLLESTTTHAAALRTLLRVPVARSAVCLPTWEDKPLSDTR